MSRFPAEASIFEGGQLLGVTAIGVLGLDDTQWHLLALYGF
jgi:hypothetical protein